MINGRSLGGVAVVLCALSTSSGALAFKSRTHVAVANEVLDSLKGMITAGATPDQLTFSVNGQTFMLGVSVKDAYAAILAQPEFFRAGAVGPDGFLDPISGQMWAHGDESGLLKDIVEKVSGVRPPDHSQKDPLSARAGLSELRAIDFATAMLHFAATSYAFPGGTVERQQVLAFITGYLSHAVTDGFSHTWTNELTRGAWDISKGRGIFGPATEEVQHVAIERLLDTLVPGDLIDESMPRSKWTVE
jgi:hypothetical protein